MPLTTTQAGTAGEQLFSAVVALTSDGAIELYRPVNDDDHTDAIAGRRGATATLSIQIKTALHVQQHDGLVVAKALFTDGVPWEHPRFVYAVCLVQDASLERCWLIPSADFNRQCYRGNNPRGNGIELEFMAHPDKEDKWSAFRCSRSDTGPRLLALIDSMPAAPLQLFKGATLVLRRA